MPSMPSTNSGRKVELNARNMLQKWILARRSLKRRPTIFGIQ